eukprot:scaffold250003_cov17-Tisochrysis_lutea.AAC.1
MHVLHRRRALKIPMLKEISEGDSGLLIVRMDACNRYELWNLDMEFLMVLIGMFQAGCSHLDSAHRTQQSRPDGTIVPTLEGTYIQGTDIHLNGWKFCSDTPNMNRLYQLLESTQTKNRATTQNFFEADTKITESHRPLSPVYLRPRTPCQQVIIPHL